MKLPDRDGRAHVEASRPLDHLDRVSLLCSIASANAPPSIDNDTPLDAVWQVLHHRARAGVAPPSPSASSSMTHSHDAKAASAAARRGQPCPGTGERRERVPACRNQRRATRRSSKRSNDPGVGRLGAHPEHQAHSKCNMRTACDRSSRSGGGDERLSVSRSTRIRTKPDRLRGERARRAPCTACSA